MADNDPMWRDRAACLPADPELFFPNADHDTTGEALAYCRSCPVVADCDAFATRNKMQGVWGGKVRGPAGHHRRCVTCDVPVRPGSAAVEDYPGTRALVGNGQCQTCWRAARNRSYDEETERLLAAIRESEAAA